jgi:hypothetical protein
MKKKLFIRIIILIFTIQNALSQSYIPMLNNSTWNIVSANFGGQQNLPTAPGIDVIIGSFTYKKFVDPTTNTDVYLREDVVNRRVYRRVGNFDQLLYDFGLSNGSSITLSNGYTYSVTTSTVNIYGGGTRKKIYLYNAAVPGENWIEGVGSSNNPFRPYYELPSDPYIYLTCSAQNGVNIYNHGIANGQSTPTDCSTLLGIEDIIYSKQEVNFSPNPFQKQLTITKITNFENSKINLYNSIGQIVKVVENINGRNIVIDRENLISGIYFAQITENGKIIAMNKIIISE